MTQIDLKLCAYIAEFIKYELSDDPLKDIDSEMIKNAIDAYNGGAR